MKVRVKCPYCGAVSTSTNITGIRKEVALRCDVEEGGCDRLLQPVVTTYKLDKGDK